VIERLDLHWSLASVFSATTYAKHVRLNHDPFVIVSPAESPAKIVGIVFIKSLFFAGFVGQFALFRALLMAPVLHLRPA
jgi:hypothetical protein